ncbi:MAG: multicopper oxidase domain-containing protein [Anaerolineales bacterium]|nr:multicopper oxidase domain-containing protein [Anaerolineales bacterium]
MNTIMTKHKFWIGVLALLAAVLCLPYQAAHAQAPDVTFDLCATTGTLALPGGVTVPIWGYALGDCSGSPSASLPGPTLTVNAGETVQINLHNNLGESTTLNIPGVSMLPDVAGADPGFTKSFTFEASEPGTYLYEAGLLSQHQVAMGMFGALVVNPSPPGQAYNDASTAFDDEAILILSEIDPNLNNGTPSAFDLRTYSPKYFLINGLAYPDTTEISTVAGNKVLLRYLNAGLGHHSVALTGLQQRVIAVDGSPLTHPYTVVAETIAPGQGIDVITAIPASAPDGSHFALYDGSLMLNNRTAAGFGGMMTFLTLAGGGPGSGDTEGPVAGGTAVTPSGSDVLLTATIDDTAKGGSNVQAAEYYLDSTSGTPIAMTASDGSFDSPTENVEATISAATLSGLSTGNHTIYVRGQDVEGNWGSFNLGVLHIDNQGPATSALTLSPNPSGGNVGVVMNGTASEAATGGSTIIAAEYFVDATGADGSGTTVTRGGSGTTVSLNATIPAGLPEGVHTIYVHAQDGNGLWGGFATIDLLVDQTGPATSGVTANPNPNNGSLPYSLSQPSVRVNASISDALNAGVQSNISMVEGFIDYNSADDADGTGFPFTPADGLYNEPDENAYAFVPLTTIATLSEGVHTIAVHGKDASGNWGPVTTTDLIIDKTGPTLSGASAAPNPTEGAASVTLSATASETVVQAEWYMGTDPGVGNGTAMSAAGTNVTAVIDITALDPGSYTLYLRAKDAAGNWGAVSSATFVVSAPAIDFSTVGNTNPPGVGGGADDSDIYRWNGAYSRVIDATTIGVPGSASVDGFHRVDDTHFYLSFSGSNTFLPGLGNVQDEDVVFYNAGTWSVFFNGTALGLTGSNEDIDAFSVVDGVLYFSMLGNTFPADDADIYSWNGSTFAQVWDATANGLPGSANVDGLKLVDATHFYLSFTGTVFVPGVGNVQDEDIVYYDNGTWSLYFDGTANGLGTSSNLDIDAFDFP